MKNGQTPKLHFGRLKEVVHARNEYFAEIPNGTTIEDILKPEYWAHYAKDKLRPLDVIECFCDDASWECSLRVMYVAKTEVKMSLRWKVAHDNVLPEETETDVHEIKWHGPTAQFAIVRKDNNEVLKDRLYPKSEAAAYLKRHLEQMQT